MATKRYRKNSSVMALFGNVAIPRIYCRDCGSMSFVVRGRLVCCGLMIQRVQPKKYIRVAEPENVRRLPPLEERKLILEKQDNRCFYCGALFDTEGIRKETPVRIKVTWDHQVPYAYSQDNRNFNYVAACQVCNSIKGAMVFQTVDEARAYLALRREEKGYDW